MAKTSRNIYSSNSVTEEELFLRKQSFQLGLFTTFAWITETDYKFHKQKGTRITLHVAPFLMKAKKIAEGLTIVDSPPFAANALQPYVEYLMGSSALEARLPHIQLGVLVGTLLLKREVNMATEKVGKILKKFRSPLVSTNSTQNGTDGELSSVPYPKLQQLLSSIELADWEEREELLMKKLEKMSAEFCEYPHKRVVIHPDLGQTSIKSNEKNASLTNNSFIHHIGKEQAIKDEGKGRKFWSNASFVLVGAMLVVALVTVLKLRKH